MEMGGLTANLPRGQPNPNVYLKSIEPSATIYSWVMNNHWHTNYRADQEGPTWFHFAIRPHGGYDAAVATRFGVESTEPLIVASASGPLPIVTGLRLEPASVVATAFKPSDDGKALIVRLFNPTDQPQATRLNWSRPVGQTWLSSGREDQLEKATSTITLPKFGNVTLRVDQR
jgi:alpha-mannosidase